MNPYWLGVLTPFAIAFGVLLLGLLMNLFGAIISWAWKKAHYGLMKKMTLPATWDEESNDFSTRPKARQLVDGLTASGEFRILPAFGWIILIVREHRKDDNKEK